MRVCFIGSNSIDEYFTVKHGEPVLGSKVVVSRGKRVPGGMIANAACVMGNLGGESYCIDQLPLSTPNTKILLEFLKQSNVSIDGVNLSDEYSDRVCMIMTKGEERLVYVIDEGSSNHWILSEKQKSLLSPKSWIYTVSAHITSEILQLIKERNLSLFLDCDALTDAPSVEILAVARAVSINEHGLKLLKLQPKYYSFLFDQLKNGSLEYIISTLGEKGGVLYTKTGEYPWEAPRCTPVDTTGAGDAFNSSFLYGLLQGWNEPTILKYSAAVAALTVESSGARVPLSHEKICQYIS